MSLLFLPKMNREKYRDLIKRQLADLALQEKAVADSTATVELDQSRVGRLSRMDALQTQAIQKDSQRRIKEKIKQLSIASARVKSEDFGYCDECGELIAEARLELNPAVTLCIGCAEKAEKS